MRYPSGPEDLQVGQSTNAIGRFYGVQRTLPILTYFAARAAKLQADSATE